MARNRENGFTLYELLITLLVIGVILTLGVPNFRDFTANSRMTSTANDLHSAFLLARTEAARTKANVTICASDASVLPRSCAATSFDTGWIVFTDATSGTDDTPNLAVDGADVMLRSYPSVDALIDITTNGGVTADYFTFASTGLGFGTIGANPPLATATICDDRGNTTSPGGWSAARVLVVTPLGRSTVLRDEAQITAQGGCP